MDILLESLITHKELIYKFQVKPLRVIRRLVLFNLVVLSKDSRHTPNAPDLSLPVLATLAVYIAAGV